MTFDNKSDNEQSERLYQVSLVSSHINFKQNS